MKAEYKISTAKNPAGYTAGTYEYVVEDRAGNVWSDGGYESAALARAAARKLVRQLNAAA